jgi:hypothetical protein
MIIMSTPPAAHASVYLCSFKANARGVHGIVSRGIRLGDNGDYSHTELAIVAPGQHATPFSAPLFHMSASGMDGGVRSKTMQISPARWDVLALPYADARAVELFFHDRIERSKGYDYFGTGRFALPFLLREHPTRDFCSEFGAAALGIPDAWRYSPSGLHAICIAMGGVPVAPPTPDETTAQEQQ